MPKQSTRQLKISALYRRSDNRKVPELRLRGLWIESLGFKAGGLVNITVREGLMIIEAVEEQCKEEENHAAILKEIRQALKKR